MSSVPYIEPFPAISLPPNVAFLLKENMGNLDDRAKEIFQQALERWPHTLGLLRFFSEFDSKLRWQKILSNIGWNSFRDRLTSIYLYHALKGRFPQTTMPELLTDVLAFEAKLLPYSVGGPSRAYMLGLYFKLVEIEHQNEILSELPSSLLSCLEQSKSKVVEIDLLFLVLWHYCHFLGEKNFEQKFLHGQTSHQAFYTELGAAERRIMCTNLLHYGHAIGEKSWFTEKRV